MQALNAAANMAVQAASLASLGEKLYKIVSDAHAREKLVILLESKDDNALHDACRLQIATHKWPD